MPATLRLEEFGAHVYAVFGHPPYHVGSSLRAKRDWRDVDVRLILSDDEYDAMFGAECSARNEHSNEKWVALVLAFSALGKAMTGLPIDFQIQRQSEANEKHDGPRSALGIHRHLDCARRRAAAQEAE